MQYILFCCIINLPFINKWGVGLRIKKEFELVNRSGQNIVVLKNGHSSNQETAIILNDTAVFLWNILKEKDYTKTQMLEALLAEFDISTVLALGDIDVFVRTMKENEIFE